MDAGAVALIVGIVVVLAISRIPLGWLKSAGGLLIALTLIAMVVTAVQLLGH